MLVQGSSRRRDNLSLFESLLAQTMGRWWSMLTWICIANDIRDAM